MNRQKKRRAFFTHIFSPLGIIEVRALLSLSHLCIFCRPVVQSSSRRRLFPTPANQVSENGRNTAPLLLALRSAAHRTACVFSLSLSLSLSLSRERERERERGFDSSGTQCLRFTIYRVVATSRVFAKSRTRSSN